MDKRLTLWILAGMILGVVVGYMVHISFAPDSSQFEYLTKTFKLLSDIFLNLIKLLVAPLILSTIVVGIAHMGDSSALGRIGFRAITWFITASFISIGLGLLMVNVFQPGVGAPVDTIANAAATVGEVKNSISGNLSSRFSEKRFRSDGNQQHIADFGVRIIRRHCLVGPWREGRAAGSWC